MKPARYNGGYVALMATIIIAMVLLVMVGQEGFAGWHARYNVLGTELKEQANVLADGCADQALSRLLINPFDSSLTNGTTNVLPSGTCVLAPIDTGTPGKVYVQSQAQVGNAATGVVYANLGILTNVSNIYVGATSDKNFGTIVVQTLVRGGTAGPESFTMHVSGSNSTFPNPFAGSASGIGGVVTPDTSYSVSEDPLPGYRATLSNDCSGTIHAGDIKVCTVVNDAVTTTVTVLANVSNKFTGSMQPADFTLTVDGTPISVFGQAVPVVPGLHSVSVATTSGYLASDWGYQCAADGSVSLNAGDNKVCIINIADIPPPNPSCADTVMMLDRTGSMSSSERSWLQTAANLLTNLYSLVTVNSPNLPAPSLGVGSFGGITAATVNSALVPNNPADSSGFLGILTTVYSDLSAAITKMMSSSSCSSGRTGDSCTDISAAVQSGSDELGSGRHNPDNQKVLILISDGIASLPSGTTVISTGTTSPAATSADAGSVWKNPQYAFSGSDNGLEATSTAGSSASKQQYYNIVLPNIPSDATINGIEADADAWSTAATGIANTSPAYPSAGGDFTQWVATGGTNDYKVTTATDATDATYIDTASALLTDTVSVANATGVPTGATINSVTLYVKAKGSAGATLTPVVAKNSTTVQTGSAWTLTTSYATYSYAFPKTGDSKTWTQSEVTNWSNSFGVRKSAGSAAVQVTQMWVVVNYTSTQTTTASTATSSPSSTGSGSWTSPSSAYASDNVYSTDATSGGAQVWANFGFSIPSGATITGIQLGAESKVSGSTAAVNTATLAPIANGNYTQWSGNNYAAVDETGTPACDPNGEVIKTGTTNSRSSYKVDISPIPIGSTINSISVTVGDRGDTAANGTYKPFIRINTSDTDGSTQYSATGTSGSTCTMHTQTITPSSGVVVTSSTSVELGVVKTSTNTATVRVGVINATINYTPPMTGSLSAALSWNNGANYSSAETVTVPIAEVVVMPAGNSQTDTWGSHTWVLSDFNNGNFVVRLTNTSSSGITVSLDQLTAKIYYTTSATATATSSNLYPSASGDFTQWVPNGTTKDYTAVGSGSGTGSMYIDTANSLLTDTMAVPNISSTVIPSGATINSVTLYVVARGTSAATTLYPVVAKDSTHVVQGPAWNLSTSYTTYSYALPTTGDSKSWTQAEVTNWTNGFGVRSLAGNPTARVTQVYVVVSYSTGGVCQLGVDLSWDGGTSWVSGLSSGNEQKATLSGGEATYTLGGSSSTWGRTWYPAEFATSTFRARVRAIDQGSTCQSSDIVHLDWLRFNVFYTGSAAKQAALAASDAAKQAGVNIFSIYYNSSPVTTDENFMAELASGNAAYAGHENGSDNNPYSQVILGKTLSSYASATASPNTWSSASYGYNTSSTKWATSNISSALQAYKNFNFNLPPASSVTGIEVDFHAKASSSTGCSVSAELSQDGGQTYTATGLTTATLSTSDKSYALGGSSNLWGSTWTTGSFDVGTFIVRLKNNCSSGKTLSLDRLSTKLTYSSVPENEDGDNFFIAPSASDMPGVFDYIGNNVCPAARPIAVVAPSQATLLILTRTINNYSGTASSSNFTVQVNGTNPSATNFAGVEAPGVTVTLDPGTYSVTESALNGYTEVPGIGCSGDSSNPIAAGETRVCILTNNDLPPPPPLNVSTGTWQEVPSQ